MESGVRQLTSVDLNTVTATKQETYGAVGMTADGRRFRYVQFGGTAAVAPGTLWCTSAVKANAAGLTITAVGTGGQVAANLLAGSTTLVVTNSSTAVTADEFAEGFLNIIQTSGTAEGPVAYRIRGNTAAAATTGYITIFLNQEEPLRNAETLVAGTDLATLDTSPYVTAAPAHVAGNVVGANVVQIPNSSTVTNYGWAQVGGQIFMNATSGTKGYPVTQDLATNAGYVANVAAGASEVSPVLGIFKEAASSSLAQVILNIN